MLDRSSWSGLTFRFFQVAAKLKTHGRHQLVGEIGLATRSEAFVKRGGQYMRGYAFIDGGIDGPASFAGVRGRAPKVGNSGVLIGRAAGRVEQPRADDAAAPPEFRYIGQV